MDRAPGSVNPVTAPPCQEPDTMLILPPEASCAQNLAPRKWKGFFKLLKADQQKHNIASFSSILLFKSKHHCFPQQQYFSIVWFSANVYFWDLCFSRFPKVPTQDAELKRNGINPTSWSGFGVSFRVSASEVTKSAILTPTPTDSIVCFFNFFFVQGLELFS